MRIFIAFLLAFCIPVVSYSQSVYFEKAFGTEEGEVAKSIREFQDGSLFVGGWRENGPLGGLDYSLSKLDKYGNFQWTKFFGTPENESCLYMTKTSDGFLLLCGESQTVSNGLDALIIKADTAGNEIWRSFIGGPENESLRFIEETSDGSYVAAGFQNDAFGSNDSWFVRITTAGSVIWSQPYGAHSTEYADAIRELPQGGFIASGDTKSSGNGGYDVQMFRLSDAGVSLWDATYGDQFENGCQGLIILNDGNFLSYGETEVYLNSPYEIFLEKIDTSGNSMWKKNFGGSGTDAAFGAVENADGTFILTGYTNSLQPGPLNLMIAKTDTGGNMIWMRSYGSSGIDIGYDIQTSIYGGYLIAGRKAEQSEQYYVLHVNEDGFPLSDRSVGDPAPELIYPNPAADWFSATDPSLKMVRIYDRTGRVVKEEEYKGRVSTSDLEQGVYIVELLGSGKVSRSKLLVIH